MKLQNIFDRLMGNDNSSKNYEQGLTVNQIK